MKFNDILSSANSNLKRNKVRSALTILAIFIGSFTIILSTAINAGVGSFIDKQIEAIGGEGYMDVAPASMMAAFEGIGGGGGPVEYNSETNSSAQEFITEETIKKVEAILGVIEFRPFQPISAEYITSGKTDKKYKIDIQGMDTDTINLDIAEGRGPDANTDDAEITLLPDFAKALGFEDDIAAVGQEITLAIKNQITGKLTDVSAKVVGVQAPSITSMGRTWISASLHDKIYDITNAGVPVELASRVYAGGVTFDTEETTEANVKKSLEELDLVGMTVADEIGMVKTFFDVILIVFAIFGGIALLAASIGIINTLFMSVQERTREIGLMKAMGLSSAKVFLSFSLEAIMLGLYGSIIGIAVSMLVGHAGNAIAHMDGSFLAALPTFNLVEFTIPNLLLITTLICFIAFLAGTLPARRAAKQNPIDALRYE